MIFSKFSLFVITILLSLSQLDVLASDVDSLRTEKINGQLFIIHQVDAGETLYSISRRYNVSIPQIVKHNPKAKLSLELDQILNIPLIKNKDKSQDPSAYYHTVKQSEGLFAIARQYGVSHKDIIEWNNLTTTDLKLGQKLLIKKRNSNQPTKTAAIDTVGKVTHQLQPGETLFQLYKRYGVSVEQLKEWNGIKDNSSLSVGQIMIVGQREKSAQVTIKEVDSTEVETVKVDTVASDTTTVQRIENVNGFEEIIQSGIAEVMPGSLDNRKYLGLHRTAKIGTIMKVRNEMNNKIVFVRIIGRIPDTGDNRKVLIKISKPAYDRLGVLDPRFRAEISYMP